MARLQSLCVVDRLKNEVKLNVAQVKAFKLSYRDKIDDRELSRLTEKLQRNETTIRQLRERGQNI